jgi:hypothetical protein
VSAMTAPVPVIGRTVPAMIPDPAHPDDAIRTVRRYIP